MDKKFEELRALAEAAKGKWGRERDEFEGMATPTVILELITLAQRATEAKPSASAAPGIDTPEFRSLLLAVCQAEAAFTRYPDYPMFEAASVARKALIDHINGVITVAREASE